MSIHLKTALDHIRRSPFQALAASFVLAITFFVITLLSILVYSSQNVITYFETRPQVIAFLKEDVPLSDIDELRTELEADSRITSVNYVSKEQALEIYKQATSDNPLLSELVSPTIFPASLEFSLTDLNHAQAVIDEVTQKPGVDEVGFTANLGGSASIASVVERLRTISLYLKIGGSVVAGIFAGTSFLVLLIIIGMRMTARKEEVEILSLIGATDKFIKRPIVLESILYALGGVFAGWFFVLVLTLYSTPTILSYFGEIPVIPRNAVQLLSVFGVILAVELVLGFVLAVSGSLLAVSRARKKK